MNSNKAKQVRRLRESPGSTILALSVVNATFLQRTWRKYLLFRQGMVKNKKEKSNLVVEKEKY